MFYGPSHGLDWELLTFSWHFLATFLVVLLLNKIGLNATKSAKVAATGKSAGAVPRLRHKSSNYHITIERSSTSATESTTQENQVGTIVLIFKMVALNSMRTF